MARAIEQIAELKENVAKLQITVEDNNKTVHQIEQALYGNGKPGLLSDFRSLKESVERHHRDYENRVEDERSRKKERKLDWQWVITALIAIAGIVAAILK